MKETVREYSIDGEYLRPGKYTPGSRTVALIIQAARDVLIEEGSAAFTLRRIAARCNLQLGNVSRHFPRKEILVQALLYDLLTSNEKFLKNSTSDRRKPAAEALKSVIVGTLEDIGTKRTTHLSPEFWAMSNHNELVAARVEATYRYVLKLIGSFVAQLNPSLNADQVETVALFINATMEGTTMLAGYGKPWEKKMPELKAIAAKWLINMAKEISPEEIDTLSSKHSISLREATL